MMDAPARGALDAAHARIVELEAEVIAARSVLRDMLSAVTFRPSCQAGAIERCRCLECARNSARAVLGAPHSSPAPN